MKCAVLKQLIGCSVLIFMLPMGHAGGNGAAAEKIVLVRVRDFPEQLHKADAAVRKSVGMPGLDLILSRFAPIRIEAITGTSVPLFALSKKGSVDPVFRWIKVVVPDSVNVEKMIQEISRSSQVEAVEPNRVFHLHFVPNDPLVRSQWALTKIQAFNAWDLQRGRSDVLVAVIDSGIDYKHPDLAGNIWINPGEDVNKNGQVDESDSNGIDDDLNGFVDDIRGWDFTDAPNYPSAGDYMVRDNDPMDEMGHGTAVAGIIAATAQNGIGVAGLAHGCRLMCLRSMNANGYGEEDDVASAILYAVSQKAAVINMSWGDTFVTRLLDDVIRYTAGQNVVLVASAGNSRTDIIHYPSGFEPVISVGATTPEDRYAASFTNFGATIDLTAPGQDITSTTLNARYDSTLRGTSFAAPYVSAAAALLLSQNPGLSPTVIRGILTATADDLGARGWDQFYGAGRLNIYEALRSQSQSNVQISSPWLDDGFSKGPIEIRGSAWTSTFSSYALYHGLGQNPQEWSSIVAEQTRPVIDNLLGTWQSIPAKDSSYTIRLVVNNDDGSSQESLVRVLLDRTPPDISQVELWPMLDGDHHSVLIQYHTSDLCEGAVFYRSAGVNEPFLEAPMAYRTLEPRLNFSSEMGAGKLEFKVLARNGAGLTTTDDNKGRLYPGDLSLPPIDRLRFTPMDYSIPHGHLLNAYVDFNQNRIPELISGTFLEQGGITCQLFEFNGSGYKVVASLPNSLVPRDIGDTNGNKKPELMAGYGFSTFLFENQSAFGFDLTPIKSWEGSSTEQYWGSRLADVDGDEKDEVIIRIQKSENKKVTDQFEIWKYTADGQYSLLAPLPNPTTGENYNGVPHCVVADFDGDGRTDILLGDSDGDLYIYERGPSGYVVAWQDALPLEDAIEWTAAGDFDGDGLQEFIAGCHSDPSLNSEHSYDARHWYYRIYDSQANNSYTMVAEWRFFGYESTKDFPSGVTSGDVDRDGRDEILITVYPDFYIAEMDDDSRYQITFHSSPVQCNSAMVIDSNHDGLKEFWISDGKQVRPYRMVGAATAPPVPVAIVVHPLDEKSVELSWYPVPGADHYLVSRGTNEQNLQLIKSVTTSAFIDSNLQTGQLYWYALACIDNEKSPNQSITSRVYSARPGAQPFLLSARCESERAVRLYFSEPLADIAKDPTHYRLNADLGRPSSCAYDKSGQEIVLSLAKSFDKEGYYAVSAEGLADLDGTPMDQTRQSVTFHVSFPKPAPYLAEAILLQDRIIQLVFSEPMEKNDLMNLANYDLGDGLQVVSAQLVDAQPDKVKLELSSSANLGALGKKYLIRVRNIKSANGVAIQPGRGDAVQLVFSKFNLSEVYTYPNPFRKGLDPNGITFANLTIEAEIRVMTCEGRTIRVLNESNGDGGVIWDCRDEQGNDLASGIYIYKVSNHKESKYGKLAIVR
jgi:subtilisin family serine protease